MIGSRLSSLGFKNMNRVLLNDTSNKSLILVVSNIGFDVVT